VEGLWAWGPLVGQIVDYVESGVTAAFLGSLITSVSWEYGDTVSTTLRAGFAQAE
jgi:hypothetical protein